MATVVTPALVRYEALPGRVVFGVDALAEVAAEVGRLAADRVMLIDGLLDAATLERVERDLGSRHTQSLAVERQHVPAELVADAERRAAEVAVDLLLVIGGGSALGVAKAVARSTHLPILAIPTTYAGSEMTPIWGVTAGGSKTTGRDLAVLPRTVIYDPRLTASLPPRVSGASGMNAVAHCVEAMWTEARNPVTDAIATDAIALLAEGLRAAARDPGDMSARSTALRGAWLAGTALAVGGTALHHKICHVLGGTFDLPHADVHAAVLPWVVEHFREVAPDALRRTAAALGDTDAVSGLRRLARQVGASQGLAEMGFSEADAERAADGIAAMAPDVPAPVTRGDVLNILQGAMASSATSTADDERSGRG